MDATRSRKETRVGEGCQTGSEGRVQINVRCNNERGILMKLNLERHESSYRGARGRAKKGVDRQLWNSEVKLPAGVQTLWRCKYLPCNLRLWPVEPVKW